MKTLTELVAAILACAGWFVFAVFAIGMALSAFIYYSESHPERPGVALMLLLTGVVCVCLMMSRSMSGASRIYDALKRLHDEDKAAGR